MQISQYACTPLTQKIHTLNQCAMCNYWCTSRKKMTALLSFGNAVFLFHANAAPLTILAYFSKFTAIYHFLKCKPFQFTPLYFIAEYKTVFFNASFVDVRNLFFACAYTFYIIGAFFADNITFIRQAHNGVAFIQKFYDTSHRSNKFFTVSLSAEKLYAKAVMRTQFKI